MAKHDIVLLNTTSSGFETNIITAGHTARIKGDGEDLFSVRDASGTDKFSVDTTNSSVTFATSITSSGHLTSSVGSTGSFGRVDVTRLSGDASQMTNVNEIGHISTSAQLATAISGAFTAGFTTTGNISGSITSTGSFGLVYADVYVGNASLMTNVNEAGHFSSSAQMASNISGSHTSGFTYSGAISGSPANSTASIGKVSWVGQISATDVSGITNIVQTTSGASFISSSAQIASSISGSFNKGFTFDGKISGSATSTGSFSRLDFTTITGDASQMTNVPVDTGTLSGSAQIASSVSGSFTSGFQYEGNISGSVTSTGSFGTLSATTWNVTNLDITGSEIQAVNVGGIISSSAQISTAISGSFNKGFNFTGKISGSVTSTGSFARIEATKFVGDGAAVDISSAYSGVITASSEIASQISGSFTSGFGYAGKISGSVTSTGSFGRLYSTRYVGDATAVAGMTGLTEPEGSLSSSAQIADSVSGSFQYGFTFTGSISGSSTSTGSLGRINAGRIYANSFNNLKIDSDGNTLKYNAKDLATEISGAFEYGFPLTNSGTISGSVTSTGSFGQIKASVVSTADMTTGPRKPVSGSMDHLIYLSGSYISRRTDRPFRIPIFGRGHDISTQQFITTGSMQSQKYRHQAGQLFIDNFGRLNVTVQTGSMVAVAGTWSEGPDSPHGERGVQTVGTRDALIARGGQNVTGSAIYNGISWSAIPDATHLVSTGTNNKSTGTVDAALFIGHTGGSGNTPAPYGNFPPVPNHSNFMEEWNGVSFQRCTDSISPYSVRYGAAAKGGSVNSHITFAGDNDSYGWPRTSCWNGVTWQAVSYAMNNTRNNLAGFGGVHDAVAAGGSAPLNDCTEEWNGATWATATALPAVQTTGGGMGATQNAGLIAGGAPTDKVQEYNGTTWSEGTALSAGTTEHSSQGTSAAGHVLGGLGNGGKLSQWTGRFITGSLETHGGNNQFSQNPTGRYLLTRTIEANLSPSVAQTTGITSGSTTYVDGINNGKGFGGGY